MIARVIIFKVVKRDANCPTTADPFLFVAALRSVLYVTQ